MKEREEKKRKVEQESKGLDKMDKARVMIPSYLAKRPGINRIILYDEVGRAQW